MISKLTWMQCTMIMWQKKKELMLSFDSINTFLFHKDHGYIIVGHAWTQRRCIVPTYISLLLMTLFSLWNFYRLVVETSFLTALVVCNIWNQDLTPGLSWCPANIISCLVGFKMSEATVRPNSVWCILITAGYHVQQYVVQGRTRIGGFHLKHGHLNGIVQNLEP